MFVKITLTLIAARLFDELYSAAINVLANKYFSTKLLYEGGKRHQQSDQVVHRSHFQNIFPEMLASKKLFTQRLIVQIC